MSVNTLERRDDGSYAVRGELTFATVPGFLTGNGRLLAGGAAVTVDLAGVDRADSAGVALLVEWLRLARAAGRELSYRNMPQQLEQLIRVSGLEHVFSLG